MFVCMIVLVVELDLLVQRKLNCPMYDPKQAGCQTTIETTETFHGIDASDGVESVPVPF